MHFCESCNYKTTNKSNYNKHCKTKKHLSNENPELAKVSQKLAKVSQKLAKVSQNDYTEYCIYCGKGFKHKSSRSKHQRYRCKKIPGGQITNNITNNTTNNITNNTNNNLNIILKIGSVEEAEKIKSLLTPEVILKLCEPKRAGYPRQAYDMIKNISNYSIQLKQNNKELQNFKKTNARDNMIDTYDENWNKEYFGKYLLKDLQKYTEIILKKCEEKAVEPDISRDEKLEIIKEVCQNYDKYKKIDQEDMDGIISFTLDAIDEQIKEHKILHYNITNNK